MKLLYRLSTSLASCSSIRWVEESTLIALWMSVPNFSIIEHALGFINNDKYDVKVVLRSLSKIFLVRVSFLDYFLPRQVVFAAYGQIIPSK